MKTNKNTDNQHCGSKPRLIAFGLAPLGIISVGIVPMGVLSVGVVPMGVFSLGAVAMGIINISIVGMGIISFGITTMGIWEYSPKQVGHQHNREPREKLDNLERSKNQKMLFKTKEEAENFSKKIDCKGTHKMGEMWMACNNH